MKIKRIFKNFKNRFANLFQYLNKPLVSFLVILLLGIQLSFLISYWYFLYKDRIWATEGIRDTLTYQGKITNADGVPPPDGLYNMRFRIYDQAASGTLLWSEIWDGTNQGLAGSKVQVTGGIFTVELNSLCGNWVGACSSNGGVSFTSDSFYLQVELDYDGNGTFEEVFTPRKRFTATPYSMNADKLDGHDSLEFLLKEGDTMAGNLGAPKFIDSSLAASYRFDGDPNDSSPNSLDGTLQNSSSIANDVLTLDGTNQYFSALDNDKLSFGNGSSDAAFSLSAWIKMNDTTNFIIASKGTGSSDDEYKFFTDANDKINLQLIDQSQTNSYLGRMFNTALTNYEGEWVNVIATYDGLKTSAGIKIYLNGLEIDDADSENNTSSYAGMENLTGTFNIGNYAANYANGQFDEFKIYNRALSTDEIKRIYESDNRQHIHSNKITTHTIYLEYVNGGNTANGYLTWDAVNQRIKFSAETYAPNQIPFLENRGSSRDYTHYTDTNIKLAYDFSDSVGTAVTDLAGNANGTLNGNADWTNLGYIGYGLKFGADGDSVSFADPGLSSTTGTIEMWVKFKDITTSATNYLIKMSQSGSNEIGIYKQGAANLMLKVGDSGEVDTLIDVPDTNWHHLALTWNTGNYELFVDSTSIKTGTYANLNTSAFTSFYLGSAGAAETSLNGSLDSVAIYDDVLTVAEITNHYNSAFENLYVANNLSSGSTAASLGSLLGLSGNDEKYPADPVYFNNSNIVVGLGFNEGQGTTTVNVTDTDNPTISGAKWVKGYYGYGLDFNGADDYLSIADSANINMGTGNFSLEFYMKADSSDQTNKRIISKLNSSTGYEVYFDSNNKISFFLGDGTNTFVGDVTGGTALNDGKWHHVALSLNRSGNATLFYDTIPIYIANITSASNSLDNTADLYIGKNSIGNNFKGILDDVIIYKDFLWDLSDLINRRTKGSEIMAITNRGGVSGIAPLLVLNNSADGDGAIAAIFNSSNTTGYPLKLWSQAPGTSGSDTIYNLIAFGNYGQSYGNLIWDDTSSQFIFDKSLKTAGDLAGNFLSTNNSGFLAFDFVRHTLTSDDVSAGFFTEAWSKATKDKIVSLHGIDSVTGGNVIADQDWSSTNIENRIEYDGTNIRVDKLGGTWNTGDVVTIFIVYEK